MPTYDNPVISGFHPDPSVCRVGDDYYLVCSSFEYFPGLPIFHSKDLVHWEQIGNVLDRPGQLPLPLPGAKASGGLYAPTIRHHDGRYWVINTNIDGGGNFVVSAERPEGPWSDPVWIDLHGIDPDLAWEEDGTCWCAFSGPAGGINTARIDPVGGEVLEGPFATWSGSGLKYPEAPHLYRIGDWWYLLIAEGGTERGHSVSVARGRSPRGRTPSSTIHQLPSGASTRSAWPVFWMERGVPLWDSRGLAGAPSQGPRGERPRATDTLWPRSVPPSAISRYHQSPMR
jgi:beta-xylosidase